MAYPTSEALSTRTNRIDYASKIRHATRSTYQKQTYYQSVPVRDRGGAIYSEDAVRNQSYLDVSPEI
jgi:hypothetical protein